MSNPLATKLLVPKSDKEGNKVRPANSLQTEDDAGMEIQMDRSDITQEEQSQVDAGKMESRTFLQLLDELQLPK